MLFSIYTYINIYIYLNFCVLFDLLCLPCFWFRCVLPFSPVCLVCHVGRWIICFVGCRLCWAPCNSLLKKLFCWVCSGLMQFGGKTIKPPTWEVHENLKRQKQEKARSKEGAMGYGSNKQITQTYYLWPAYFDQPAKSRNLKFLWSLLLHHRSLLYGVIASLQVGFLFFAIFFGRILPRLPVDEQRDMAMGLSKPKDQVNKDFLVAFT